VYRVRVSVSVVASEKLCGEDLLLWWVVEFRRCVVGILEVGKSGRTSHRDEAHHHTSAIQCRTHVDMPKEGELTE
jgi:hypothetical protein